MYNFTTINIVRTSLKQNILYLKLLTYIKTQIKYWLNDVKTGKINMIINEWQLKFLNVVFNRKPCDFIEKLPEVSKSLFPNNVNKKRKN